MKVTENQINNKIFIKKIKNCNTKIGISNEIFENMNNFLVEQILTGIGYLENSDSEHLLKNFIVELVPVLEKLRVIVENNPIKVQYFRISTEYLDILEKIIFEKKMNFDIADGYLRNRLVFENICHNIEVLK